MILRNLAHSIRRQDWFAVAIEFLIVVAGNSAARSPACSAQHQRDREYTREMVELQDRCLPYTPR